MALAPWGVLAQGKIRSDAEEEKRRQTGEGGRSVYAGWERTESEKKICRALEEVAEEVGAESITAGMPVYRDERETSCITYNLDLQSQLRT